MPNPQLTFSVDWSGSTTAAGRDLAALVDRFRAAALQALREEAEIEMTEAKKRTPVRTGNLRASGTVTGPDNDLNVHLTFGGPAAPYAVFVHENLEAHHPNGQAKFLESVVNESAPTMADRLAARIRAKVGE